VPESKLNMPRNSSHLGEKLLGLIPRARSENNSDIKTPSSVASYLLGLALVNSITRLLFIAVLAALCGTGVLFLLNTEAKAVESHNYNAMYAVFFIVMLLMYRSSQNYLIKSVSREVEEALDRKRQRVVDETLSLSLRDIEEIGRNRIRDGMAGHYMSLSQSIVPIINGFESLILLICLFGYVLYLSVFAAGMAVLVVGLLIIGYLNRQKKMASELEISDQADAQYRRLTDAVVGGAKELQLSTARRSALEAIMKSVSTTVANGRSLSAEHFAEMLTTGTTAAYLLAGSIVFIMPLIAPDKADMEMSRLVIAIIFLLGPIGSVLQTMQQVTMAQFALSSINAFELEITKRYANYKKASKQGTADWEFKPFQNISLKSVGYTHAGSNGFSIQNIDLKIEKGEVIFLTGGNGSGKTTLLSVLTGLYPRASGSIFINEQELPVMLPQQFRELFASVFTDFFIFDQPFGLDEQGMVIFEEWLNRLNVRDKFTGDIDELGKVDLSTGQRKRVALALALAEQRPILILDEWAADQDPDTRRIFYEEILPTLKNEGITIFAITHDEQYFHCCDRRLNIIEGQFSEGMGS
jgi:putative ATP-binding cassette transporter